MVPSFDRSQPWSEIQPIRPDGGMYEQRGFWYRADFTPIPLPEPEEVPVWGHAKVYQTFIREHGKEAWSNLPDKKSEHAAALLGVTLGE